MTARRLRAIRGRVLHCLRDPADAAGEDALEYFPDGALLVADGHIAAAGPAESVLDGLTADAEVIDYSGCWVLPGFVDCHVHYPQIDIIAAYGERLLEWLDSYVYPAEAAFDDRGRAAETAQFFVDELLRNGTTTAMVFATVHPQSVDAVFTAALARNMRLFAGKVMMDRNCPRALRDTPESGYRDSRRLLEQWHGRGRLQYAITIRFAPTSSAAQLAKAAQLAREFPSAYVHTHLAESQAEIDWVAELFPDSHSYLDVYARHGLVRERSVFAHCLHLDDADVRALADQAAAIAFCPSSNLFLGSGLFDLERATAAGVPVGLATDVGAGTSLSLPRTIGDAYKALQLRGQSLTPQRALYLATLGAATALRVDAKIGNFAVGKEADFVVLDPSSTPLLQRRLQRAGELTDELFALLLLSDDRNVRATYLMGRPAHRASPD